MTGNLYDKKYLILLFGIKLFNNIILLLKNNTKYLNLLFLFYLLKYHFDN